MISSSLPFDAGKIPLFHFTRAEDYGPARLAHIGGGLLIDSGEADTTFLYRCQERYLVFTSLRGQRSLFFAHGENHIAAYRREISDLRGKYNRIAATCGVLPAEALADPVFVLCDPDSLELRDSCSFRTQLRDTGVQELLQAGPAMNQISPIMADFLAQLHGLLHYHGIQPEWDIDEAWQMGRIALHYHDKVNYVKLVPWEIQGGLPPHVPTAILDPKSIFRIGTWDSLVAEYIARTQDTLPLSLFVKSSFDSGGNAGMRLEASNFNTRIDNLRHSILTEILDTEQNSEERAKMIRHEIAGVPSMQDLRFSDEDLRTRAESQQARRRRAIMLLIQREVAPPSEYGGLFAGIGLSYHIQSAGESACIAVAGQVYKDQDRRSYLGAYVSDALTRPHLSSALDAQMRSLCRLFAKQGYRGPISFDARLNSQRQYVLIYDCNPRLTAIFPALAVSAMLRGAGHPVESVLSLGYRGEFVWGDLDKMLEKLDRASQLYTLSRPRGLIVLPNLCRKNGYDIMAVNMEMESVQSILASGILHTGSGTDHLQPVELFY